MSAHGHVVLDVQLAQKKKGDFVRKTGKARVGTRAWATIDLTGDTDTYTNDEKTVLRDMHAAFVGPKGSPPRAKAACSTATNQVKKSPGKVQQEIEDLKDEGFEDEDVDPDVEPRAGEEAQMQSNRNEEANVDDEHEVHSSCATT